MVQVRYEWTAEHMDEYGDIVESDFDDSLTALLARWPNWKIGLVCDMSRNFDYEGTEDRQWAYPVNGKLPEYFDGGRRVPVRFHREWKAVMG